MKLENLEQLNEVIVRPLQQALVNNEHVDVFRNYDEDNWELRAAAHSLENPDLTSQEVLNVFDRHLYAILNNGQTQCNSNFLALAYGYTYLFQRINAIEEAFKALNYGAYKTRETGLFVDIGCGIGALLVALRNLHENNDFILNYRGYDIVEEVLQVNGSFLNHIYPENSTKIDGKCIESFGGDEGSIHHVIMVYSYIFSQKNIDNSALQVFKNNIDSLFDEFDLKRFYIVYINIEPSYYNINYINFMKILKEGGYEILNDEVSYKQVNNYRLYNLSTRKEDLKIVPGSKSSSKIHCTVSEIRRV